MSQFHQADFFRGFSISVTSSSDVNRYVSYALKFDKRELPVNPQDQIRWSLTGRWSCNACGSIEKKLYRGFCYSCLKKTAQADLCVLNPHRCHYAKGTCREPEWGLNFCFQDHGLYLSDTGTLKIGLTRWPRLETRWSEQGAQIATPLAKTASRRDAGILEKAFESIFKLQSNWKKMLTYEKSNLNFFREATEKAHNFLKEKLETTVSFELLPLQPPLLFFYPGKTSVKAFQKIEEQSFLTPIEGIKGKYLIFSEGVWASQKWEGAEMSLEIQSRK